MSTPPTHPTAAPVRCDAELARFESIDGHLLDWAREWRAEEAQFPVLIDGPTLGRAEYPEAFPHLLMSACRCVDPAKPGPDLLQAANLGPTGWLLSPAVCYHAYPRWEGETIAQPRILTARGRCFRNEAEFTPGRRQLEFEMREIVLCGEPGWIEQRAAEARGRIEAIAAVLGFHGTWETAEDPFFLPTAQGKALIQRLQETKKEFVVRNPAPLAVASINRHGTFFGERFRIGLAAGGPAHTACIAFGLDRWASSAQISQLVPAMPQTMPPTATWHNLPPAMQAIHARLLRVLPGLVAQLRPDASFAECGGDSIDFVELLCVIEADFGVRFGTNELTPHLTVADLLQVIDQRATKRPASAP